MRALFHPKSHRINFQDLLAIVSSDKILVDISFLGIWAKGFPNTPFVFHHGKFTILPISEIADHMHGLSIGGPNTEGVSFLIFDYLLVSS